MPARVLLAMGCEILREGLRDSLRQVSGVGSVTLAPDGVAALREIESASPDVAVLDDGLAGLSCVDVIEHARTRGSACRCIVLIHAPSHQRLELAIRAGAAGFVLTTSHARELAEAVRVVLGGATTFPRA